MIPTNPSLLEKPPGVTILGGGPVGWLAALCIARSCGPDMPIRMITGRRVPAEDGRAAAMVGRSMDILASLGLEERFRSAGARLAAIRIIDATGRLLRAPTTTFRAVDLGEADFGVSLTTAQIVSLLRAEAEALQQIEIVGADVTAVERHDAGGFALVIDTGAVLRAPFLVAADGQRSLAREAAGLSVRQWSYPQVALTFPVSHTRDHGDVSTEFHTPHGPFTLVPNGPLASTVVWMTETREGERLMALDDEAFSRAAERTSRSILGKLTLVGARGSYPMRGLLAPSFVAPGLALVGETGHAFPPIGAQGLNLGFRDADTLGEAIAVMLRRGEDFSAPGALAAWDRGRRRDAGLRTAGVDLFNRSLLAGLLPVDMLRGAGLAVLSAVPPLRQGLMRMGLARTGAEQTGVGRTTLGRGRT